MNIIKYPSENELNAHLGTSEPLMMLVSFDGETAIVSHLDEAVEHHILLAKAGFSSADIDKYFRIIFDNDGADWTFVCPSGYRGIPNKEKRLSEFYKDGCTAISAALAELGYFVDLKIPKRYRRHFDLMSDNEYNG